MLESLRHYARERLDAAGGSDAARRRHAQYYATAATQISTGLRGPDETSWRRHLDTDLDNFRSALTWALDSSSEEDGELGMVILGELGAGFGSGGATTFFAGTDYEQAVERARKSAAGHASLVFSSAAIDAYYRGDFRRGRELSREGTERVRTSAHPGSVLALNLVFVSPRSLDSQLTAALRMLDENSADTWDYAELHATGAAMAAVLGNVDLALHEAAITLEMGRYLRSTSLRAQGLYALGLASWQSDPTGAKAALEEHLEIARATGFDPVTARVLALLAQLQTGDESDFPAALTVLREAVDIAHIDDDRPATATCLARGAVVMAALGELVTAAVFWGAVTDGVFAGLTVLPDNEIPGHSELMTLVQSQLGHDGYTAATAQGAAMTYDQITAYALAAVESVRPH
jgi:hypothetical protein